MGKRMGTTTLFYLGTTTRIHFLHSLLTKHKLFTSTRTATPAGMLIAMHWLNLCCISAAMVPRKDSRARPGVDFLHS